MRRLGDVIAPASGRAGSGHSLPVYSVTKHAGFVPQRDYFKKQVASVDTSSYKVVRAGQFAYATIHLDEGAIGFAPEDCIVSPMYTVFSVDSEKVDITYLLRLLRSPQAIARYGSLGRGSAERRKSISLKALGSLLVPIPDLQKQRRIAAILDAADAIRAKRRAQLTHLDELPQALFREMFGGGFDTVRLGDVASFVRGVTYKPAEVSARGVGVMRTKNVQKRLYLGDVVRITPSEPIKDEKFLRQGDTLISSANSWNLVGRCCFVDDLPERFVIGGFVVALRPSSRIDPLFLHQWFSGPEVQATVRSFGNRTTNISNLDISRTKSLLLPLPPLRLQQEFADKVEAIHAERARVARALEADDELFAALQHRAFRGEL
ncbi:restriction endonuclease subunit S [Microbacterium sediminis]|uniref:Uncharacterized protein n=1 Tax=Microbacterium sediminis TaxID=904291 RepID=A0A1B9NIS1_9MICO|nr:restriction endonuclease subunit S [Microbacterium sediminis]OCG76491.1 hypothetical protein A7J15_11975 [Microbacterium sediminis]QBR73067.1 restriction endonuclease subunit S [Microbacterium sediminis]